MILTHLKIVEEKIKSHDGLTNLIYPKDKIGVLRSIDANLAYNGDQKSISRVIKDLVLQEH